MVFKRKRRPLHCSFCGKIDDEVAALIAGPDVHICNECIALCNDILTESKKTSQMTPPSR